ncbi:MAG: hypothetical protein ACREQE_06025, partial [Candidatus Binataceae bacterium]
HKALLSKNLLQRRRDLFEQWYAQKRDGAWYSFAASFDLGRNRLRGKNQWKSLLSIVGTRSDPYFQLLRHMNEELGNQNSLPWVAQLHAIAAAQKLGQAAGMLKGGTRIAGALSVNGPAVVADTLTGNPARGISQVGQTLDAAKAFAAYQDAVRGLSHDTLINQAKAEKIAADYYAFAINPAAPPSSLNDGYGKLEALKKAVVSGTAAEDPIIWSVVGGPLRSVRYYADQQAACSLQAAWQSSVLWQTQSPASRNQLSDLLFGPKGLVWNFTNGPAAPFLRRDARAYAAVRVNGAGVSFDPDFITFLDNSLYHRRLLNVSQQRGDLERQQSRTQLKNQLDQAANQIANFEPEIATLAAARYQVTLTGLPSNVNRDARAFPYETVLNLKCASGNQVLKNYNFPGQLTFSYSPSVCGDTKLEIHLQNMKLLVHYGGPDGFIHFLSDFADGSHRFLPADFPQYQGALLNLGIKWIDLGYRFTDLRDPLQHLRKLIALKKELGEIKLEQSQLRARQSQAAQQGLQTKIDDLDSTPDFAGEVPAHAALCWPLPAPAPAISASEQSRVLIHQ